MSSDELYRKLDEQNGERNPLHWCESSAPPTGSAAIDSLVEAANAVVVYCGAHGRIESTHPSMIRLLNVLDDHWPPNAARQRR